MGFITLGQNSGIEKSISKSDPIIKS